MSACSHALNCYAGNPSELLFHWRKFYDEGLASLFRIPKNGLQLKAMDLLKYDKAQCAYRHPEG
jgi:hypothetical protein